MLAVMIARRARLRFRVRIEVSYAGGQRAWGIVAGDFEQRLAAQVSPVVSEALVESEVRRGRDSVRVRLAVTARAADLGQAAVIAWDVFKVAAGDDVAAWDMAAASAEIQPMRDVLTREREAAALTCTAYVPGSWPLSRCAGGVPVAVSALGVLRRSRMCRGPGTVCTRCSRARTSIARRTVPVAKVRLSGQFGERWQPGGDLAAGDLFP
jgi:hypothetical protein